MTKPKEKETMNATGNNRKEHEVNSIHLLGCPFCGNAEGIEIHRYNSAVGFDSEESDGFGVVCNVNKRGCGVVSGFAKTRTDAVDMWNKRTLNCPK